MPLMIYVGGNIDVRRSKAAFKRRAVNAAKRGWTPARIQAFRQVHEGVEGGGAGSSGKGGGAGSSGKGSQTSWSSGNTWNTSWSSGSAW